MEIAAPLSLDKKKNDITRYWLINEQSLSPVRAIL